MNPWNIKQHIIGYSEIKMNKPSGYKYCMAFLSDNFSSLYLYIVLNLQHITPSK